MRPIVALLTDFGSQDYYVGAVKGAVLAACPDATLVDIAHDLPAHEVEEAAYCLAAAVSAFPAGTVFLVVVDPGVGSGRRALAVEAGGYRFVGPDNGVFSLILNDLGPARLHHLSNEGLFRKRVSSTFHGRDIFAPVAGQLACGTPLEACGPELTDPVVLPLGQSRRLGPLEWEAHVLQVDRFGNLTTDLTRADLDAILEEAEGDGTRVVVVASGIVLPLVNTYTDVSRGEVCALTGSTGRLEVAVNLGSASRRLSLGRGGSVRVRIRNDPPGPVA